MWKVPHIALKQSCNCYLITLYTILLFKENSKGGNIFTFIYISLFINLNYFLGFIFLFLLSSFSRYFSNQHIFLIFIYLDNTMFYLTFWKKTDTGNGVLKNYLYLSVYALHHSTVVCALLSFEEITLLFLNTLEFPCVYNLIFPHCI